MSEQEKKSGLMGRLVQMIGLKPQQANMVKLIALALALGILFLNAGELFGVTEKSNRPPNALEVTAATQSPDDLAVLERETSTKLEQTLAMVNGAGKVRVSVTLQAGPTAVPVMNTREERTTTDEKAGDNSTRQTTTTHTDRTNVVTKDGNRDALAVEKRLRAPIAGVLIVAEGARSSTVRARIHEAAMTALGIPAHRISVVPAEGR